MNSYISGGMFIVLATALSVAGMLAARPDSFRLDLGVFKHFQDGKLPPSELLWGK